MRTALLTSLLLAGTASIVAAMPEREETTGRISYNINRKPDDRRRPDDRRKADDGRGRGDPGGTKHAARDPGWIELASPTPASHGREFVVLGADAGRFDQLRIVASSGRPEVHTVRVDYLDGRRRVFEIDRVLDVRRGAAYLDLRGAHEIKQIIVASDRASRGSYVLEGHTGDTHVAMR